MNRTVTGVLAALALIAPAAGVAAPSGPLASVESAARVAPDDGGAAIELANAYWRAGRTADAHNAYRRALALDNVMLETRTGDAIWSHEVARRMLASQTLAAR